MMPLADSGNVILGTVTEVVAGATSVATLLTQPAVLPFVGLAFVTAAVGTWRKLVPTKKK